MGKAQTNSVKDKLEPLSNDDEMVITPGGPRQKSKVHLIEPGYHISGKEGRLQKIETKTGKVVEDYGEKIKPSKDTVRRRDFIKAPKKAEEISNKPNPSPETNDWIVNSGWSNTSGNPISYFSTKWVVPPAPATDNGQLIYLFNGMQDVDDYIFQPVLQWGVSPAGGGSYWSVTNWYAGPIGSGVGLHGVLQKVNTGDVLQGILTLTDQPGGKFSYLSSFIVNGVSEPASNNWAVTAIDELNWAVETLECYYLTAFTDYPDTALTAFYDIEIKVRTQELPTVIDSEAAITWDEENRHTDNGQKCLIISNDSPGGDVYLYYKDVQQSLYFVTDKSTFGKDEVTDVINSHGGNFYNAFWLILEGFTIDQLTKDQPVAIQPALSGDFDSFGDVIISAKSANPAMEMEPEFPGDLYMPQRIRFPFNVQFTGTDLFPTTNIPLEKTLQASINIGGTVLNAATAFELVAGEDPYFTNIDPNNNVFYLSQDLRVFSVANGDAPLGGPAFSGDAYGYIQSLLGFINTNNAFTVPSNTDPLNNLPGQVGYETADSSVTPVNAANQPNYNFAIARVRLQDIGGASADKVRVFFRLFVAQSADTDFQPGTTYQTITDAAGNIVPIASGTSSETLQTIPFFATGNADSDYNGSAANGNIQNIQIPMGQDSVWKYYGCYLNIYDATIQSQIGGTHHCIVAEINYDGAPITNSSGITQSPENSDKLAQRNLQITTSGNPSYPSTHRIPQAFDTRPSQPLSSETGALLNYPDELMIDWGNIPANSIASIYWPEVNASDVLQLASRFYSKNDLLKSDVNTVQCKITSGITYLPIPSATGKNFAGLFTVELPNGITVGQEFNIKVRRITSRVPPPVIGIRVKEQQQEDGNRGSNISMLNWRYVTGTFGVKIPVVSDAVLLPPEENMLAVLKWRQQNMSPLNRWYPVLQRYIMYVSGRVNGAGGNANAIPPSLTGTAPGESKGGGNDRKDCKCTHIRNRCTAWLVIAIVPWIAFWVFTIWAAVYFITVGSTTILGLFVLIIVFVSTLLVSIALTKKALVACD